MGIKVGRGSGFAELAFEPKFKLQSPTYYSLTFVIIFYLGGRKCWCMNLGKPQKQGRPELSVFSDHWMEKAKPAGTHASSCGSPFWLPFTAQAYLGQDGHHNMHFGAISSCIITSFPQYISTCILRSDVKNLVLQGKQACRTGGWQRVWGFELLFAPTSIEILFCYVFLSPPFLLFHKMYVGYDFNNPNADLWENFTTSPKCSAIALSFCTK